MKVLREKIRLRKEWREVRNREKQQMARPLKGGKGERKDTSEYMWPCLSCGVEISNKSKARHWKETKKCLKIRGIIP